jgi:hypothetical protein
MERIHLNEKHMIDSSVYAVYPIAWIEKSQSFVNCLTTVNSENEFLVADFASGEHDRVPSFFVDILPRMHPTSKRVVVYCTDIHAMRLDSLMGKLEESAALDNARVVQADLESMDLEAKFRPAMIEYLESKSGIMTNLDCHLIKHKSIPMQSFDIGILNNDVVGYLHEYYAEYSDAAAALQKVHATLKKGALLVVTMPSSLYVVDNVGVLEKVGFKFLEGKDIDLSDGSVSELERDTEPRNMSRLGHYSYLIFVSK